MRGGVYKLNVFFLIIYAAVIALGLICLVVYKPKHVADEIIQMLVAFVITAVYLILSCAVAGAWYISRSDVIYGLFFFGMMICLKLIGVILEYQPKFKIIVPLLLVVILVECGSSGRTYSYSTVKEISSATCFQIGNDIIDQIKEADRQNLKEVELFVPVFSSGSNDNWPLAEYGGNRISSQLYKYRVTKNKINVTKVTPIQEKNKLFNLNDEGWEK